MKKIIVLILFFLSITVIPTFVDAKSLNGVTLINNKYADGNNDGLITDDFDNLRYIGENPNNYVLLNNEIWRIIGVFNIKTNVNSDIEKRIKLIRDEPIGQYNWDYSVFREQNSDFGISNWSTSDIAHELNTDYLNYDLTSNKTWYYNKTFNYNHVLKKDSQKLIENAIWNLGGNQTSSGKSRINQYQAERGTGSCKDTDTCKDNNLQREFIWIGKVGLIYPSDYAYATGDNTSGGHYNCSNYIEYEICKNDNWLYNNSFTWTMIPTTLYENVFSITPYGGIGYTDPLNNFDIRPVVYLKSEVLIESGDGTQRNPYLIKLPSKNNISIINDKNKGIIKINTIKNIEEGNTVSFELKVKKGYKLTNIIINDSEGNDIEYKEDKNQYTFEMPSTDVIISPKYRKIEIKNITNIINPNTGNNLVITVITLITCLGIGLFIYRVKESR